ncbi:MAG: UbiA family prenyltransferase [Nannocystaceae bacterium]
MTVHMAKRSEFPWWRRLLQLNVLVALGAASIAATGPLLAGGTPRWQGAAIAFGLVLAVYNFDRIADRSPAEGHSTPERAATVARTRAWMVWLIPALLLGSLALAAAHGLRPTLWSLAFPAFGVAYVLPLLPFRTRRPKDVPYLKCFYTAACWMLLVGIGLSLGSGGRPALVVPFVLFVFLRMFASTYLGDLRDMQDDAAAGLVTIAGTIGRDASYRLLDGVHLASAVVLVGFVAAGAMAPAAVVLLLPAAIGFGVYRLYRRFPHQHELLFELYDIENALYAPCLLLAGALVGAG